jgi:ectoine hydroxylase-related dioxygenase (phytanoyl-CoA dioxygenase family)
MIRRVGGGNLKLLNRPAPEAAAELERDGCAIVRQVLEPGEVAALKAEIAAHFDSTSPDRPQDLNGEFRHGMLNVSPLSQRAVAARGILDVIEPLLGEDCHVIANTAWRNVAGHQGGRWHIDAGPHVPRPPGVAWPAEIPYPVFAVGVHLFLEDCPLEAGPTAVLAGSHRSGQLPPPEQMMDLDLTYDDRPARLLAAKAGDAAMFVSDVWHRGTPAQDGYGRFFLQIHYGRRDIAQRIMLTEEVNHLSPGARERAATPRERTVAGLHPMFFYDA